MDLLLYLLIPLLNIYWTQAKSLSPDGFFHWGNIGDSWSSGVAYDNSSAYDDNLGSCLRLKDAWPAQMMNDTSWTEQPQQAAFKGCSGSVLYDLAAGDGGGQQQLNQTGAPQVVIITSGGNNVDYASMMEKCVFVGEGLQYNDDVNGTSECKKAIADRGGRMSGSKLANDIKITFDDIFQSRVHRQSDSPSKFWLYVNLYAHFFNADTDWCDQVTFSPWWESQNDTVRFLQKGLRKEINDLIDELNDIYKTVINSYEPPANMSLGYIDINPAFDGHRFCEPGHTAIDQWYSPTVWLWNIPFEQSYYVLGPIIAEDNAAARAEVLDNLPVIDAAPGDCNHNMTGWGWRCRIGHPNTQGHTAIKDMVIARLRADKVPGVMLEGTSGSGNASRPG